MKPYVLMHHSYQSLLEDLQLIRADDPYMLYLISNMGEQVEELIQAETKETSLAFTISISLLSKIIRLQPLGDVFDHENGPLMAMIDDLASSQAW